jgi:hypothetical protein
MTHRLVVSTLVAAVLASALACYRSSPRTDIDDQARAFFRAAASGDASEVRKLATADDVAIEASSVAALAPRLLQSLSHNPHFAGGKATNDSAQYFYRGEHRRAEELLTLELVKANGVWKVYYVGLTNRD